MTDYATATDADTIRIERSLPGPIERVWAYLTESDKRATWLAAGDMDLREGGAVQLTWRNSDLSPHRERPPERYRAMEGYSMDSRILACDPPHMLTLTWGGQPHDSEVEIRLAPEGERVRLVLTHRRLNDRTETVSVAGGWHVHLDILGDVLEGAVPRPFWSTHNQLERHYEARL